MLLALSLALPLRADDKAEARTHAAKAQALLDKDDAERARREAFEATGLDEDNARAWWVLGLAEKALGHKDKARKAVERALDLDPAGKDLDRSRAQAVLDGLVGEGAKLPARAVGDSSKVMAAFARYVQERDRRDRVVGQGSVSLDSMGGDRKKAEKAATRAALASLAEAMQTRITVITQASEASDKADSEIQASTKEESEALLRDVDTRGFDEFPLPGRVTVLASMDRELYLNLLTDEKILQRSSGWGIAARFGPVAVAGLNNPQGPACLRWGGELSYGGWSLGAFALNGPFIENSTLYTSVIKSSSWNQGHLIGWGAEGGWDWQAAHPWKRFQLYVPLRAQVLSMTLAAEPGSSPLPSGTPPSVMLDSVRAGVGCRWWGSDLFALDLRATYGVGLNQAQLQDVDGTPFYLGGQPIGTLTATGLEFTAAIRIGWL
jgi:tetratricopeptide (TPR) repeat protein